MTALEFINTFIRTYVKEDYCVAKDIYVSCVCLRGISIKDYLSASVNGDYIELISPMRTSLWKCKTSKSVTLKYIGNCSLSYIELNRRINKIVPAEFANPKKVWEELARLASNNTDLIDACMGHTSKIKYEQNDFDELNNAVVSLIDFPKFIDSE